MYTPSAFIEVPENWSLQNIKNFQLYWDGMMGCVPDKGVVPPIYMMQVHLKASSGPKLVLLRPSPKCNYCGSNKLNATNCRNCGAP